MLRSSPKASHVLAVVALLSASGAVARDGIVVQRGWMQVDYVEGDDGACRTEVRTNGRFYRIAGAGWQAGETVWLRIRNANVRPIEYRMTVDDQGYLVQYYVPFLWNHDGGTVTVDLASATCQASLAFDWTRQSA